MNLEIGQIWRKHGPYDWLMITGFQLPDKPNYDGALAGVSVRHRVYSNKTGKWYFKKAGMFIPASNEADFVNKMKSSFRFMEQPNE